MVSANALRHMEVDLARVTNNVKSRPAVSPLDEDEVTVNVDGQLLSHLVGEVSEVGLDESGLGSIYDLQASGRKFKTHPQRRIKSHAKYLSRPNLQKFPDEWHVHE